MERIWERRDWEEVEMGIWSVRVELAMGCGDESGVCLEWKKKGLEGRWRGKREREQRGGCSVDSIFAAEQRAQGRLLTQV